jgi:uncharacterized protein YuzE
MKSTYLEVTFRKGKAMAAYLYLPRQAGDRAARTEKVSPGMLVDYAADGRPIGIEFTSTEHVRLADVNAVLAAADAAPASAGDLAPLAVA